MPNLSHISHHYCFGLYFKTALIGKTVTLLERPISGDIVLNNWLEVYNYPPLALREYKRRSVFTRSRSGHPLALEGSDSLGNEYSLNDGGFGSAFLLLESNMIGYYQEIINYCPLTVGATKLFSTFIIDNGQILDIEFQRTSVGFITSLGDEIIVDSDGHISDIKTSNPLIKIKAINAFVPDWSIEPKDTKTYIFPEQLNAFELEIGERRLPATFVEPLKLAFASALFIGGSGKHDRHGRTGNLFAGYGPLLDGMAQAGVASLRFDRMKASESNISMQQIIIDGVNAWQELKQISDAALPKIIIGHSLGGLVALALANECVDVAAIVLIATPGRNIKEVILDQLKWFITNANLDSADAKILCAEHDAIVSELTASTESGPSALRNRLGAQFDALKEIYNLDVVNLITPTLPPVLIIDCEHDIQVTREDTLSLMKIMENNNVKHINYTLKGLNHLLQSSPPNEKNAVWHYGDQERKIEPSTIQSVIQLVRDVLKLVPERG